MSVSLGRQEHPGGVARFRLFGIQAAVPSSLIAIMVDLPVHLFLAVSHHTMCQGPGKAGVLMFSRTDLQLLKLA